MMPANPLAFNLAQWSSDEEDEPVTSSDKSAEQQKALPMRTCCVWKPLLPKVPKRAVEGSNWRPSGRLE